MSECEPPKNFFFIQEEKNGHSLLTLETSVDVDFFRFAHLLGSLIMMLGKNGVSLFLLNLTEAFNPVQKLKNKRKFN